MSLIGLEKNYRRGTFRYLVTIYLDELKDEQIII